MRKTEIQLVCDQCGRTNAATWTVQTPEGERSKVDLCTRCDDPVRRAFVAGRRSQTGPQGADALEIVVPWSEAKEKRG